MLSATSAVWGAGMAQGTVTRKLAAILYADVVGYSRLMGVDEAGNRARWAATRRKQCPEIDYAPLLLR